MTGELCPHCGRPMPQEHSEPTSRELDVLAAWWGTKDVRKASEQCGISYQRAKNILARCRNRSGAKTNDDLLVLHMDALRSRVVSQNTDRSAA